jgi:hypothetical protein
MSQSKGRTLSKVIENVWIAHHAEVHQRIWKEQNVTHAPTSKAHQAAPDTPYDNATLYDRTGRPTRYGPGDGTRKPPRQKLTTPRTTTVSHTVAAHDSPMVVSSIMEKAILSNLVHRPCLYAVTKLAALSRRCSLKPRELCHR